MVSADIQKGDFVYLAGIDLEKNSSKEAEWSRQLSYTRFLDWQRRQPMPIFQVKSYYDDLIKRTDQNRNVYPYSLYRLEGDELIGGLRYDIRWAHSCARIFLGVGDPNLRFDEGLDCVKTATRFGFHELNLQRLEMMVLENETNLVQWLQNAGFVLEVTQREMYLEDGQRLDVLWFGCLSNEWQGEQR